MITLVSTKKLDVPRIDLSCIDFSERVKANMDRLSPQAINIEPWPAYVNNVKTDFTIAHNGDCIFLKYTVLEDFLVAKATTNGNLSNDSCVEFFVALNQEDSYYNFEFNCLGWGKIGYGKSRKNRILLSQALVESIVSKTEINSTTVDTKKIFSWEIMLSIPLSVFCFSDITTFNELKAKGNFYKCGDALPQPHYLAWNLVETPEPDFHKPEYFAPLNFG